MKHTEPKMQFSGSHKGEYLTIYTPPSGKTVTMYSTTKQSAMNFIEKQLNKGMDNAKRDTFGSINKRSQK